VGGGVQTGSTRTSATKWPPVPAPGDCGDGEFGGMKIGRGNRSNQRKSAPAPLCPLQIALVRTGSNPGSRGEKPATNRLSYGAAVTVFIRSILFYTLQPFNSASKTKYAFSPCTIGISQSDLHCSHRTLKISVNFTKAIESA
jgi:hypothetical protein